MMTTTLLEKLARESDTVSVAKTIKADGTLDAWFALRKDHIIVERQLMLDLVERLRVAEERVAQLLSVVTADQ